MLKGLVAFGLTRRPIALLLLAAFIIAGAFAFSKLNIEAYPNPAPVIIEITAQSAGLSAEEMERLYTVPIEVGVSATPGINNIRSTSFYGLSFVRVTFDYGVDYYFALQQIGLNLQQNVNLPNNVQPQIQASSVVGEIYRYQVKGPCAFRPDQSQDHPGLGFAAPPAHRARRGAGQHLGRHHEGIRGRGGPRQAGGLRHHAAAARDRDRQREREYRRAQHQYRQAVGQYPGHRPDRQRRGLGPDAGAQGRGHRGHHAIAGQWRARTGEGRRAGLRWQRSPAGQGGPRRRKRRCRRDCGDEPHAAHQRRHRARQGRGREDSIRMEACRRA